jgi:hypothetical protein
MEQTDWSFTALHTLLNVIDEQLYPNEISIEQRYGVKNLLQIKVF